MEKKVLTRCLILIMVMMIFAGAAWYFTRGPKAPQADVVLAGLEAESRPGEEISHEL